jgi:hypothetical protein
MPKLKSLKIVDNRIVDHRNPGHSEPGEWVEAEYDKKSCDGLTLNELIYHGCGKVVGGKVKALKARKPEPTFSAISDLQVLIRAIKNRLNITESELTAARSQLESELS